MRSLTWFCGALTLTMLMAVTAPATAQSVETGFLGRSLTVNGDVFRYQVFVPAAYTRDRLWPVILFLHGGGERGNDGLIQTEVGLGSAIRRFADRFPAIVVFPQSRPAPAAWSGDMAEVALKMLDETEREYATDRDRVYLTGLSMGGSGTWYLAYRHPDRFAALLVACGRIQSNANTRDPVVPAADGNPFTALANRLKGTPIWIFHGGADTTVPVDEGRSIAAALAAVGADVTYTELPGVTHNSWDRAYRSPEVATWLLAQRRRR